MAGRVLSFAYGVIAYAIFLVTFLYAVGFIGDVFVPKTINSPGQGNLWTAVLVDVVLLGLFALQHSVMARPAFKELWAKLVAPPVERSTYVLATCVVLTALFWWWMPIKQEVWRVDNPIGVFALYALSGIGWLIVLASTFMIDHFELFGLKGAYQHLIGQEPAAAEFKQPLLYGYVRHPIMSGFLIAFWATPVMTAGHLLFAVVTTVYVLIAIQIEERDLVQFFGEAYREYRQRVPMLIPLPIAKRNKPD